jgi:hypothetical protein
LLNTSGEPFSYPVIKSEGTSLESFVPQGWKIIDTAYGDLNKDRRDDIAFVMEYKDSVSESISCQDEHDSDVSKPRILVILLRNLTADDYQLSVQNNTFIMRNGIGGFFDPLDLGGIEIIKGILDIHFYGGGGSRFSYSYKFRYQNKNWLMIGAENIGYSTTGGDFEEVSYNFLSHKAKLITGADFFDEKAKTQTKWIKLNPELVITLNSLLKVGCLQLIKGYYL